MPRLADPSASRAVLIGVASYADGQQWSALPAVRTNITDLEEALIDPDLWGLPLAYCSKLVDPSDPGAVLEAIACAAEQATDTLVVYYAGHGSTTASGLMLTLATTTRKNMLWRSVQFSAVRQVVHERRALNAVIILDCCFSGLAHAMSDLGTFLDGQIATTSAFMLTSSARDAVSLAPRGERHTAFTGELLKVLRNGASYSSELLTLGDVSRLVASGLALRGIPEPKFSQTGAGDQLAIARNVRHVTSLANGDLRILESPETTALVRPLEAHDITTPKITWAFVAPPAMTPTMGPTTAVERRAPSRPAPQSVLGSHLDSGIRRLLLHSATPLVDLEGVVAESLESYLTWQNPDGGWPSTPGVTSNAWSTAQAIYLLNELDEDAYRGQVTRAVDWLLDHQHANCGWGLEPGVSDVTGTELAIFALAPYHDQRTQLLLRGAASWLIDKQNPDDSGWAFVPRNTVSSVYCTAWGMISLRALATAANNPIYQKVHVQRGKKFLLDAQNENWRDPGWGKFLGSPTEGMRTAHALNGLLAAGASRSPTFRRGLRALHKEQLGDGGWGDDEGSNLEGTCWAIIALVHTGRFLFTRTMSRGIAFCLNSRDQTGGGWPEQPGEAVQIWCTHHSILALSSYLNAFRPLYQAPLHLLLWWRVKGQLLTPLRTSRVRASVAIGISIGLILAILYSGSYM